MSNKKPVRTRGKIQFSKYFQEIKKGESVAVVLEKALQPRFPEKLQGRTGIVEGKRGKSYLVKIKDRARDKVYLIEPVHLKKINTIQKKKK